MLKGGFSRPLPNTAEAHRVTWGHSVANGTFMDLAPKDQLLPPFLAPYFPRTVPHALIFRGN